MKRFRSKEFLRWINRKRNGRFVHGNHREPTANIPNTGCTYRVIIFEDDHKIVLPPPK
jgi:hypothetical protein